MQNARAFFFLIGLSVAATACASPTPPTTEYPADYYQSLLEGHVAVMTRPSGSRKHGRVAVGYHWPDGHMSICSGYSGKHNSDNRTRWRIYAGENGEVIYQVLPGGEKRYKPVPARELHRPITYDPVTGKLETFWRRKGKLDFVTMYVGWVQRSWPRSMKEACPDLDLPADLPINEKQTSTRFDELRAQDPEAPILAFTGKQIHESFYRFWMGNHGKIVTADEAGDG